MLGFRECLECNSLYHARSYLFDLCIQISNFCCHLRTCTLAGTKSWTCIPDCWSSGIAEQGVVVGEIMIHVGCLSRPGQFELALTYYVHVGPSSPCGSSWPWCQALSLAFPLQTVSPLISNYPLLVLYVSSLAGARADQQPKMLASAAA